MWRIRRESMISRELNAEIIEFFSAKKEKKNARNINSVKEENAMQRKKCRKMRNVKSCDCLRKIFVIECIPFAINVNLWGFFATSFLFCCISRLTKADLCRFSVSRVNQVKNMLWILNDGRVKRSFAKMWRVKLKKIHLSNRESDRWQDG